MYFHANTQIDIVIFFNFKDNLIDHGIYFLYKDKFGGELSSYRMKIRSQLGKNKIPQN